MLNDFFVKQCSAIPTGSTVPNFIPLYNSPLTDIAINKDEVLQLIRSLDSKKACGPDNVSVHMIKICDASIVEPMCLIFEKSLETGNYPDYLEKR